MSYIEPSTSPRVLRSLEYCAAELHLDWDDGRSSRFAAVWLRDNCACPECRHPQAMERLFLFINHPPPVIEHAGVVDGELVEVRFRAGEAHHTSRFPIAWLRSHCYSAAARAERAVIASLWDSDMATRLVRIPHDEFMGSDGGLLAWIDAFAADGIVLLTGVPTVPGTLLQVARRLGPVRPTNFGEYYDVVSMPDPNAVAYTALGLELHTDLPNWQSPPDVQFLACLASSVIGGESVFVDGFHVAEDLRRDEPEAFRLLSTQPLEFRFHDATCDIRTRALSIALEPDGSLRQIRFNNWIRSTMSLPEALIEPMYAALGTLWRALREPRYQLDWRLEPGQLIAYDNHRVLHGRRAFDATSGSRHLQGCYLNREDVHSTRRLLARR